jgi:xylulokinase
MLLMGLDVGTTGVKAAVFDESGEMKGYGFEEYEVVCQKPGWAEQDAERVFQAACRVMGEAAKQSGGGIAAIGLSVQGDAVIAVDERFRPVAPVQLGMDYRCRAESDAFSREFGEEWLFQKTGMRPHPLNSLCKIRNFVQAAPEIDRKTARYMTYSDYMLSRLGADEPVIDHTMATRTMGVDLKTLDWDDALLAAAGVDRARLSKPVPSGVQVGRLDPMLAEVLHISPWAMLVTGGHDQPCAAVGAGVVRPDLALDSHGTAEVVSSAFDVPNTSDAMFKGGFPCYAHAAAGMFFTFSLNHTAGILYRWFVENFCQPDAQEAAQKGARLYEYVLSQSPDAPSPVIVLPYWSGKCTPDWNLAAKGLMVGMTMATTRYDEARAIVEALCFDLLENIEALKAAGVRIESLRAVGGGARSPIGLQMKADVTGLPVHTLKVREAACLGAALLAGVAAGAFGSTREAASIVRLDETYEPRPGMHARYGERYALYRRLYHANRDLMAEV